MPSDGDWVIRVYLMGNDRDNGKTVGLLSADDIPEEYRMMLERFKEMRGT